MMLRKLLSFCQGGLALPRIASAHSSVLALEFRRHSAATLAFPLKRLAELWRAQKLERNPQENFYRTLISNAPDGVFVVNRALQFVEANEIFCRMLGRSRKEILAQTLPEILANAECEPEFFSDLLARVPVRGELALKGPRAATRIFEWHTASLPQDLFLGLARDVTEKRQREDELCRAAEWRALLLRSLNLGLGLIDHEGRVLLCNRAFENALGISTQNLQTLSLLKPLWQTPERECLWSLCNQRGTPVFGAENPFYRAVHLKERASECRLQVQPRGKIISVDAAPLHDEHNALLGAVVTLREITAQVHAEKEKEAAHMLRLQAASFSAQRTLARELAPQIAEPSSGIALYAQMLLDNLPAASEDAVLVRGILQETNNLLETIRALRALAQQRGGARPEPREAVEPVSLAFGELYESPVWLQGALRPFRENS